MFKKTLLTASLLLTLISITACNDDTINKVKEPKTTGSEVESTSETESTSKEEETTLKSETETSTDNNKEDNIISEHDNIIDYDTLQNSNIMGKERAFYIFDASHAIRNNGARGTGYVSYLGSGGTAEWEINVQLDGFYILWIEYCTEAEREVDISINKDTPVIMKCEPTGSWFGDSKGIYKLIKLNSGKNSIILSNEDAYAPNIDFIGISRVTDNNIIDDIENYTYTYYDYTSANKTDGVDISATGGMSWLGSSEYVLFNDIKVDTAGKYKLKLEYSSSSDGYYQVQVNNGEVIKVNCKDSGSIFYNTSVIIDIELTEGFNSIKIFNETEYSPELHNIGIALIQ